MPPEAPHIVASIVVSVMQYVKRFLPPARWTPVAVNAIALLFCFAVTIGYAIVKGVDPLANPLAIVQTAVQAWFEAIGGYELSKNVLSRWARLL